MIEFKKRMTEVWVYPPICKYQDQIENVAEYLDFLNSPSREKDLLIYVHIPFCEALCLFCSYYKEPLAKYTYDDLKRIFAAYQTELVNYARKEYFKDTRVRAIQFGGGTPSAVAPEFLEELVFTIKEHFNAGECQTISMEGNVLSLQDEAKLRRWKMVGVNRISFGIQTFHGDIRRKLGVKAKIADIYRAVDAINKIGFADYSTDIIYNLPEEKLSDLLDDLHKVGRLGATYIDAYNLNIYPNTRFAELINKRGYFSEKPTDEKEIIMFKEIMEFMSANGYQQVMVNTFSPTKTTPPVTLDLYLSGGNVLGIGPSARSCLNARNYRNIPLLKDYVERITTLNCAVIAGNVASPEEQLEKKMVFFPNYTRIKKSGITDYPKYQNRIQTLIDSGLARENGEYLCLTKDGKVWPGNISLMFFSECQKRKKHVSFFYSYKYKENPYNQDKMGVP